MKKEFSPPPKRRSAPVIKVPRNPFPRSEECEKYLEDIEGYPELAGTLRIVSMCLGVKHVSFFLKDKIPLHAKARHTLIFLMREDFGWESKEIARKLRISQVTVYHATARMERELGRNPTVSETLRLIRAKYPERGLIPRSA